MTTNLLSTEKIQTETVRYELQNGALVPHNPADEDRPFIERAAADLGVKNKYSAAWLLSQLSNAGHKFLPKNMEVINGLIAAVKEMNPQGPVESMLAVQMVTCHTKIMSLLEQTVDGNLLPETREQRLKLADRLMRTFSRQLEVLAAYRRKGKQSMVVKHVTVQEGGQAIVGNLGDREGR
jgi:hypothetical protein